jgi:hypothetical protein
MRLRRVDDTEAPAVTPDPAGPDAVNADSLHAGTLNADAESTGTAIRRQLLLLAGFVVLLAVLFAFAGTVLASGGGCGGG